MAKDKTAQAPTIQRRPGTDPFGDAGWRGINTESDPGSLAPNELQWAEDFRIRGKNLVSRSGVVQRVNLNSFSSKASVGAVVGLPGPDKGQADLRNRLWVSSLGCLNASATGYSVSAVDTANDPLIMQYIEALAASNRYSPIGRYGDRLFVGDTHLLREIQLITPPHGVSLSLLTGAAARPLIEVRAFDGYAIRCMAEIGGELAIGLENNTAAANSKIMFYNGTSFKDDLTGIRPPLAMGYWRDKLVVGFDATAGHIRVRDAGSAHPGTWATYALGGFQCSVNQNSIVECRDKTYIASGATQLYSFDGTTLAAANTIATADTLGDGVSALCLYQGLLHYGWNITGGTLGSRIGRHDPDATANEWVDTYLNITAQQSSFKRLGSLATYRRKIYAGGAGGTAVWLVATKADDVQGTMTVVSTVSSSVGFRTRQLLVFP